MADSGLGELKDFPKNTIYSNVGQAKSFGLHYAGICSLKYLRINLKYQNNQYVPSRMEDTDLHFKKKLLSLLHYFIYSSQHS